MDKTPHQQSRAHEQQHGECQFSDHQRAAQVVPASPQGAGPGRSARAISKRALIRPRVEDRGETKQQTRANRDHHRKKQHPPVDADRGEAGQVRGLQHVDPPDARVGQQHAADPACQGQEQALGEQLPHDVAAAGSQRHTQRHFTPPVQRPGEQQIGHVGARDEQDAGDRRKQGPENRSHITDHLFKQRHHAEGQPAVGRIHVRMFCAQAGGERVHLSLGGCHSDARFEPADEVVILAGTCGGGRCLQGERQKDVGLGDHTQRGQHFARQPERVGQHPSDRVGLAVDGQDTTHHARAFRKPPRPEPVTEQGRGRSPRHIFGRFKEASHHGFGPEHRQEVGRDPDGAHPFRVAVARQVGVGAKGDGQFVKPRMAGADVEILRRGEPVLGDVEAGGPVP